MTPFCSLVPDQTVEDIDKLIREHLQSEFAKLRTKCKMTAITKVGGGSPWLGDVKHAPYEAAKHATEVWH